MNENELLAKIDDESAWIPDFIKALRAVVKLHKPKNFAIDTDFPWVGCRECEQLKIYPCPTIHAIEKELK